MKAKVKCPICNGDIVVAFSETNTFDYYLYKDKTISKRPTNKTMGIKEFGYAIWCLDCGNVYNYDDFIETGELIKV